MTLEDFMELLSAWVGLVALALFLFSFAPAVLKCGETLGWW